MPVENNDPITVPAQPARVYDKLWVQQQQTFAPNFGACSMLAKLRPYRVDNNVHRFGPTASTVMFSDTNLFDLHDRKPYVVEAIRDCLASFGMTVPDGIPAQLFVMELLAQVWGAAAQAVPPDSTSSESVSSDSGV